MSYNRSRTVRDLEIVGSSLIWFDTRRKLCGEVEAVLRDLSGTFLESSRKLNNYLLSMLGGNFHLSPYPYTQGAYNKLNSEEKIFIK